VHDRARDERRVKREAIAPVLRGFIPRIHVLLIGSLHPSPSPHVEGLRAHIAIPAQAGTHAHRRGPSHAIACHPPLPIYQG
jgi:hypothetical protein